MIGSFTLSHESSVMRFGPEVDNQFSHGSGTSTERVKITKLHQYHSSVLRGQVDSLCCSLSIQRNERTVKRSKIFGESSHFLNFTLSATPRD